jgi:hypothetical protein
MKNKQQDTDSTFLGFGVIITVLVAVAGWVSLLVTLIRG